MVRPFSRYWMSEVMNSGILNIPTFWKCLKSTSYHGESNGVHPGHPLQSGSLHGGH